MEISEKREDKQNLPPSIRTKDPLSIHKANDRKEWPERMIEALGQIPIEKETIAGQQPPKHPLEPQPSLNTHTRKPIRSMIVSFVAAIPSAIVFF